MRSVVRVYPGPPRACERPDDRRLDEIIGGVAQLGERELCKLEVIGSIPFASTKYLRFLEHPRSLLKGHRLVRTLFDIVKRETVKTTLRGVVEQTSVLTSDRSVVAVSSRRSWD